jgi:hypothetical protein
LLEPYVEVHPIAFGNEEGEVELRGYAPDVPDNAMICERNAGHATAPLRRLDGYAQEQGWANVTLLKIDTEGYDPKVIAGAEALIRRDRPVIVAELLRYHLATHGTSVGPVWDLLVTDLGYRAHIVRNRQLEAIEALSTHENVFFLPDDSPS